MLLTTTAIPADVIPPYLVYYDGVELILDVLLKEVVLGIKQETSSLSGPYIQWWPYTLNCCRYSCCYFY